MDWPVASIVLGFLGTVCAGIIKFSPARETGGVSEREFQALQTRVDVGFSVIQSTLTEIKQEVKELRNERT